MAYHISSGQIQISSMGNVSGGVQYVMEQPDPQIIYLDFDGELTRYQGEILTVDAVAVRESRLSEKRIAAILSRLNAEFAALNVCFVKERPADGEYSTIFIGRTEAFDAYGKFAGLAETVDSGNRNRSDNAFVMLDADNTDDEIVNTIAHETGHLIGILDHGGEGLKKYADIYYNQTYSGLLTSHMRIYHNQIDYSPGPGETLYGYDRGVYITISGTSLAIYDGGSASATDVNSKGRLQIFEGGRVYSTTVNSGGWMMVYDEGMASSTTINNGGMCDAWGVESRGRGVIYDTTVNSGGLMIVSSYGYADNIIVMNSGYLAVLSGGTATNIAAAEALFTFVVAPDTMIEGTSQGTAFQMTDAKLSDFTIDSGGRWEVLSGGTANRTTVNSGGDLWVSSGGTANRTTVNSGGDLYVFSGGTANSTTVNSGVLMEVWDGGTANATTINSNAEVCVRNGGIFNSGIISGGSLSLDGVLSGILTLDGGLNVFYNASANGADIVLQVHSNTSMITTAGIEWLDYLAGVNLTVQVDPDVTFGTYHLASYATDFTETIIVKKGDTATYTYTWDSKNLVYVPDKFAEFYALVKDEDRLDLVYQSYVIHNFDELKTAVSIDLQQFKTKVKLDDFKDGWGKQTNHRSYYNIEVTDLAFQAEGSTKHIDIACNGHINGRIGILSVDADLTGNDAGLFLSLDKDPSGKWQWGDWDLVGKFAVTLQQVDHRYKFHLFNTTFDPMKITGIADINTKTGVYTITAEYKKSGWKHFQEMTISVTLKECLDPKTNQTTLDLSKMTLTLEDTGERKREDPGLHIYKINGSCFNLAACDEDSAGFKGDIGFTWNSVTIRISAAAWQTRFLNTVGIKPPKNKMLKVSVVDVDVNMTINKDGDFETNGTVYLLKANDNAFCTINGSIAYTAAMERLCLSGAISIAGIVDYEGNAIYQNGSLRCELEGTFTVPGWASVFSSFTKVTGHVMLSHNSANTSIAIWGECYKKNNTVLYKGYRYDFTNGICYDISEQKHVDAVYVEFSQTLSCGQTASASYEITGETAGQTQLLLFTGEYSGASENLQVSLINETSGEHFDFKLADYSGNKASSDSAPDPDHAETCSAEVQMFSSEGFSIGIHGKSLSGNWRVEVCDTDADLSDFDLELLREEMDPCRIEGFAVSGLNADSATVSYSIFGADENTEASLYGVVRNGSDRQSVFLADLTLGENQEYIWNNDLPLLEGTGLYEFYIRVAGDFMPVESETDLTFAVYERSVEDDAIIADLAEIKAGAYHISIAADQAYGVYKLAQGAAGFNETVSIGTSEKNFGVLTANGEALTYGNSTYALTTSDSDLLLSISDSEPGAGVISGDLNGDGRADVIMSITEYGHGAEGATGAWLIQEDQTAVWGDLSQRNSGWTIFGAGKTAADKKTNDVYIKNTDNVIGAWTTGDDGKVNGWETIGTFENDTQILGLGDFNANGQTDLLLRNVNGAVGCFFTGGETTGWNYFQSLGDEWNLSAVGDLNGDGRSDVVLKHDAGFAGSWLTQADGTMVWANLDTLQEGFEIVGCGDFNGDGTDDVLLQKGTYFGAWLVQNGNAAGWFGIGDLGNITVEQIADFNSDGKDDLRIRTMAGDLGTQLVMGEDNLSWKYYGSVGREWSTSLAALA